MSQVIKRIGNESIYFDECNIDNNKLLGTIVVILFVIISLSLFVCAPPTKDILNSVVGCLLMSILFSLLITLFLSMLAPKPWTTYPGYRVYISCRREPDYEIYIIKTSPEADQIAICKAAKELEPKAQEIDDHEKELERIATKCK